MDLQNSSRVINHVQYHVQKNKAAISVQINSVYWFYRNACSLLHNMIAKLQGCSLRFNISILLVRVRPGRIMEVILRDNANGNATKTVS